MLDYLIAKPDVANAIATVASAVLAAVACVIAVISLHVSRKTLKYQQEHNRYSVRPIPSIVVGDYENRLFVKVVNNGVGPLFIKKIRTLGSTNPDKALIAYMPELPPKVLWTNFVEDTHGRSVPPGAELVILDFDSNSSSSQVQYAFSRDRIRHALGGLSMEIQYTDIYNSDLPNVSRDFKWFHRHLA
jgi:hypothetical protein